MPPGKRQLDHPSVPKDAHTERTPKPPDRQGSASPGHSTPTPDAGRNQAPQSNQNRADYRPDGHEIRSNPPQLPLEDRVEKDMATLALDPVTPAGQGLESSTNAAAASLDADSATMLRVRAGDDAAFNLLVEKYHRPMMQYMYRMTHNQAIAEELSQEVFLRVYRSRESYRAEARFSTWLYRIATNLGVNHARDTRHERAAHTVYLDETDPETGATPDVADIRPSAEQDLVREERMKAIRSHVMALPERQRIAVLMHKYQGLDYRQIGEILKLSDSATKSLLFRAYQALRERLKEFVEES